MAGMPRTIDVTFDELGRQTLMIGRFTSHMVMWVRIDVSAYLAAMPGATATIRVEPPGGGRAYPAVTSVKDGALVWTITHADTAVRGYGRICAVILGANGEVLPSAPARVLVGESIGDASAPVPDGVALWLDKAQRVLDELESGGGTGGTGAPGEPGNDGFSPTVDVQAIEGGHRVTITDKDGMESFDVMDGKDGHTPVKGVDYFTPDEQASIADDAADLAVQRVKTVSFHICGEREVDENGVPVITEPDDKTFYLVPSGEDSPNLFVEWAYINGEWERFGSATVNLDDYVRFTDADSVVKDGVTANTLDLTAEEQAAAQAWLGIKPGNRLIAEYTVTADETPDSITIDKGLDGEPFFLSEIMLFGIFPALASGTNRSGYVCFNNENRFTRYISSLYHPVDANKTNRLILKVNTAITGHIEYCHFPSASDNASSVSQWYSFNPVDTNLIKQPIETITFSIHQGTFAAGTNIKVYGR